MTAGEFDYSVAVDIRSTPADLFALLLDLDRLKLAEPRIVFAAWVDGPMPPMAGSVASVAVRVNFKIEYLSRVFGEASGLLTVTRFESPATAELDIRSHEFDARVRLAAVASRGGTAMRVEVRVAIRRRAVRAITWTFRPLLVARGNAALARAVRRADVYLQAHP